MRKHHCADIIRRDTAAMADIARTRMERVSFANPNANTSKRDGARRDLRALMLMTGAMDAVSKE